MSQALSGTCPISATKVFRFVHRRLDPAYVLGLGIKEEFPKEHEGVGTYHAGASELRALQNAIKAEREYRLLQ